MASSVRWAVAIVTVGLCCCSITVGQIMSSKQVDGKRFQCMHTGLSSDMNDCGTQSDWYPYVFVGTISAATPAKDGEKELQIVPDEIFKGRPTNPLIVRTSQGACFPELNVGDHWLFYLREGNPIVLDFYGNISRPVTDAQERVETLRRLETIGDNGILRGRVRQGPFGQGEAVSNAHVIAHRATDDAQFVATTDAEGRYEFQPLPPGKYRLSMDPIKSFRADDTSVDVKGHQCWDLTLSRAPHAHLGGHVQRSDGSPAAQVSVLLTDEDGSWFETMISDAHGDFHRELLSSGRYVIGINLPGEPTWKPSGCAGTPGACVVPKASLYYPNMRNRADALVISLATDETRDDIDFTIPAQ
jgi:Carboxypeptidase regulatory-like domain